MSAAGSLPGIYDHSLVVISVFIAIFASFAALDLASRITTAVGAVRLAWLVGGAVAMGTGIWAMHYVGMAALSLPIAIVYHWPTVVVSVVVAILASGIALFVASRPTMGVASTLVGSILMGGGIAAMHYIGMASMRLQAMCQYSPILVVLSVLLAICISFVALRMTFALRTLSGSWSARKFASAVVMGMAIPVMHYVGMAAVEFVPDSGMAVDMKQVIEVTPLELATIIAATILILSLVILLSVIDRRFARHAQEIEDGRLQLQSIFDNMTECLVVLDQKRNIALANRTAVNLLGLTPEVIARENTRDGFEILTATGQPLSPDQWPAALAIRGEFLDNREMMIRRKDTGRVIVAEVSTTPIKNHTGTPDQFIVSYRDISDSKFNADARARLAAIVDSSEDAIIGKDEAGIVRSWNAAAHRIFGYTAEEMIGQSILRLIPADREKEEFGFLEQLRRGAIIDQVETIRKTKQGKLVNVSLTISPIRDKDGTIVGASKIARDITARKQLERQLQQSQKMEAIGQLTGGIAHDFNNLLGVIVGNLSLLERLVGTDEAASKRVQTALKAAIRGADLTRRLLSFSSNEALSPTPTALKDSILNTLELAERTLGPEISIKARLSEDIPPVFVDRAGLESALLNLAVNARDAMPKGGTLSIASELVTLEESYPPVKAGDLKPGTYACVSVTDTGAGMSRETLERALEPFFTTKPRGKGTGLGLAMVYGFVKQSGGTVLLYSEVGYGTTVKFYLRLATEPSSSTRTVASVQSVVTPGRKVLIVDDEVELLEIASSYLNQMGYVTFQAANGASALEAIKREPGIELVVTDVIMPGGMNGVEMVGKIRQLVPGIKVIYSSGFPADALTERSGTIVDGLLLRKPYQRAEFDALVRETLEGSGSHEL